MSYKKKTQAYTESFPSVIWNGVQALSELGTEITEVNASVSDSTPSLPVNLVMDVLLPTSVRYAEAPTPLASATPLVPAEPTNPFVDYFLPDPLVFHDFKDSFIPRSPAIDASPEEREIFYRITTPYNATAFETNLKQYNLSDRFPLLVRYLSQGFPLGNMPPIKHTAIIANHSSVWQHSEIIMDFLAEEEKAQRVSGPFSQDTLERILGGPFISVPLIVAEADQGPGKPAKYRICSNASKGGLDQEGVWLDSINSNVEKEKFPTTFDTVSQVAHWVSLVSSINHFFLVHSIFPCGKLFGLFAIMAFPYYHS